jgi:hypothetical protein
MRAQRRAEEAQVRHLNFDLIQRAVLLICTVGVGLGLATGHSSLAIGTGSVWAVIAASLYRSRSRDEQDD